MKHVMNRDEVTTPTPSGRDVSIDIARGIGIVAVVVGHLTPWVYDAIYVFHMPLFFILGGIVMARRTDWSVGQELRLLLPYGAYLILIGVLPALWQLAAQPHSLRDFAIAAAKLAIGGEALIGSLGVFWFPTCYVAARLLAGFGNAAPERRLWLIGIPAAFAYGVGYAFPEFYLPWGLNVAPVAAALMVVGSLYGRAPPSGRLSWFVMLLGLAGVIAADQGFIRPIAFKYAEFGTPLISVAVAILASLALVEFCRMLPESLLSQGLARLGAASMTIMYLHLPIGLFAERAGFHSPALLLAVGVVLPLAGHRIVSGVPALAVVFLGRRPAALRHG